MARFWNLIKLYCRMQLSVFYWVKYTHSLYTHFYCNCLISVTVLCVPVWDTSESIISFFSFFYFSNVLIVCFICMVFLSVQIKLFKDFWNLYRKAKIAFSSKVKRTCWAVLSITSLTNLMNKTVAFMYLKPISEQTKHKQVRCCSGICQEWLVLLKL